MDEAKPKIFIASSSEGLNIADTMQENLQYDAEVTVWNQETFTLSGFILEDLVERLDMFDFGIFVFSFEDLTLIRNEEVKTTRDNVIFELGLFVSGLGRRRCFILMPKSKEKLHLPTDLLGITTAEYQPDRSNGNLSAALGPVTNKIKRSIKEQGLRNKKEGSLSNVIINQIDEAGVSAFYQSRKDYGKYRAYASTVDSYISTAKQSVHMVSINLMTGLPFDGLCATIKNKLENNNFNICISLLNPWKKELLEAFSPVLNFTHEKLAESIKTTLSELVKLKQNLSNNAREHLEIRVHNAIPFGSAIILDGDTKNGKIQIETKHYKAPLRKSFGFEISNKGQNELYINLRNGYYQLIEDGEKFETIIELLEGDSKEEL